MKGFFGNLFDFNHDGKLSPFERAADYAAFREVIESQEQEEETELDSFDELEFAGLDRDELEFMDEEERRETIEDAGLDPDDFDFD